MKHFILAAMFGLLGQVSFTEVHCDRVQRPGLSRINGKVTDAVGMPIPYVRVAACDPNMNPATPDMRYLVGLTVTDANGGFELWGHPNYPLTVWPISRQLWPCDDGNYLIGPAPTTLWIERSQ